MVTRLTCLAAVLGVVLAAAAGSPAHAQGPDPATLVRRYVLANGGTPGTFEIRPITEDYVVDTFPEFAFFELIFRQYPVAVLVPEGFAASNLALVYRGQVLHLTSPDQLNVLFFLFLGTVETEGQALDAGRSYLRLTQAFSQDGFYSFGPPEVIFIPAGAGEGIQIGAFVLGQVQVTAGGSGYILMLMLLDPGGQYLWTFEDRNLVEGPRPICQATKLLDPDPVVRRMAERDLLYMGRAAKPYLDEQRAKAGPELQEAIDRLWKQIDRQRR